MEKHYEKIWDCSSCGRKSISALRNLNCPSCGQTKPDQDSEKFTLKEITDTEGLALVKGGPHWICSYCSTKNFDKSNTCSGCGTPRGEKGNKRFEVRELGTYMPSPAEIEDSDPYAEFKQEDEYKEFTEQDGHSDSTVTSVSEKIIKTKNNTSLATEFVRKAIDLPKRNYPRAAQFVNRNKDTIIKSAIATVILAVLSVVLYLIFHTVSQPAQVYDLTWERIISIEEYKSTHGEGWSTPVGAYNITSESRIQSYNDVYRTETKTVPYSVTKYKDNGNGSTTSYTETEYRTESVQVLERRDPVYATYYHYTEDKWIHSRDVKAAESNKEPYWPQYSLSDSHNLRGIGEERVGSKKEVYKAHFRYTLKGETKTADKKLDRQSWDETNVGDSYIIKVNHLGVILGDIERLG